jgi:hypothetical protein
MSEDNPMVDEVQSVDAPVAEVAPTVQAPTRSADDPKIADAIQKHLDAFLESETAETPTVADTPTETPKVEEIPTEEVATDEKPIEEAVATPVVESTLPAAYVRTAKSRGWTDEEITNFAKTNPDLSIRTFERMHQSRTQEINEWADLGRKNRQTLTSSTQTPVSPVPAISASPVPALQPIDIPTMVQKFGNQELIEALAGPINAQIAVLAPLVEGATRIQAQARHAQQEVLGKIVEDFFTNKDMVPFAEVYGKTGSLTDSQVKTRSVVLELADAMIAGKALRGQQMSVQEALTDAHDVVTTGMKETIIRDKIRNDIAKRASSITLRPTATGRRSSGGPPRDRQELLDRTEARLAKAFG